MLRPPAFANAPFLTDLSDRNAIHGVGNAAGDSDVRRSRLVQSSRGTSIALASGIRDQGATSTTVHTASTPAATRV